MITKTIYGHEFAVAVSDVRPAGQFSNDADAYEAQVSVYRDGAYLGDVRWDGEDFEIGPSLLPDTDASEDCYRALGALVRDALRAWGAQREWELSYPVAAGHRDP